MVVHVACQQAAWIFCVSAVDVRSILLLVTFLLANVSARLLVCKNIAVQSAAVHIMQCCNYSFTLGELQISNVGLIS